MGVISHNILIPPPTWSIERGASCLPPSIRPNLPPYVIGNNEVQYPQKNCWKKMRKCSLITTFSWDLGPPKLYQLYHTMIVFIQRYNHYPNAKPLNYKIKTI